jgi:hypothetical protein
MPAQFLAIAKLHWLDAAHGGRQKPPAGLLYAATGRFANDQNQLFSLVLRFPTENANASHPSVGNGSLGFTTPESLAKSKIPIRLDQAELGFLAPELVADKLAPGVKLLITEGSKTVAECEIVSVMQGVLS